MQPRSYNVQVYLYDLLSMHMCQLPELGPECTPLQVASVHGWGDATFFGCEGPLHTVDSMESLGVLSRGTPLVLVVMLPRRSAGQSFTHMFNGRPPMMPQGSFHVNLDARFRDQASVRLIAEEAVRMVQEVQRVIEPRLTHPGAHRQFRIVSDNRLGDRRSTDAVTVYSNDRISNVIEYLARPVPVGSVKVRDSGGRGVQTSGQLNAVLELNGGSKVLTLLPRARGGMRCQTCQSDEPYLLNSKCRQCADASEQAKRARLPTSDTSHTSCPQCSSACRALTPSPLNGKMVCATCAEDAHNHLKRDDPSQAYLLFFMFVLMYTYTLQGDRWIVGLWCELQHAGAGHGRPQ